MKRKLKWIGAILALLLVGLGLALLFWPRDRITVDSWKQIRFGMTEKEVENVLGGPGSRHGNMWNYMDALGIEPGKWFAEPNPHILDESNLTWIGRNGFMQIRYDERRHVIGKYFREFLSTRSFIDRLRDWLGWQRA